MSFLKMTKFQPFYSADTGGAGTGEPDNTKPEEKIETPGATDTDPKEPVKTPEKPAGEPDKVPEKTVEELATEMAKQMRENEKAEESKAKRLEGLSEEDKRIEELKMKAEAYDELLKEKAALEEEKKQSELRETISKIVKESDLPEAVTGLPLGESPEDIHKNIKLLASIFGDYKKSLKPEVKGRTPDGVTEKLQSMELEDFKKMKISERAKLEQSNKPLYDQMMQKFYIQTKKR